MECDRRKRVPDGEGRLSRQRDIRRTRSRWLAESLLERLDLDRCEASGSLFPKTGAKKKRDREAFQILAKCSGRFFTKRLCVSTTRHLISMLPFQLSFQGPLDLYIRAQADRLKKVAKRVKVAHYARSARNARKMHATQTAVGSSLDQADTQLVDEDL